LKILVADHQALFRRGITDFLSRQAGIEVVAEAQDAAEAVAKAKSFGPEVVLLDLRLPGPGPIAETCEQLHRELPEARILVIAPSREEGRTAALLESGAAGYVLRDASQEELLEAIKGANDMGTSRGFPGVIGNHRQVRGSQGGEPALSEREKEVLELVALGSTNGDIALALFISHNTVKSHIKNILEKLHAKNRAQAAVYAARLERLKGETTVGTRDKESR